MRAPDGRPFGATSSTPRVRTSILRTLAAYAERLAPEASRHGVAVGDPRWTTMTTGRPSSRSSRREGPAVVSFTFGCPDRRASRSCTPPEAACGDGNLAGRGGGGRSPAAPMRSSCRAARPVGTGLIPRRIDDPLSAPDAAPAVRRMTIGRSWPRAGSRQPRRSRRVLAAGACAAQLGTALLLTPRRERRAAPAGASRRRVRRG